MKIKLAGHVPTRPALSGVPASLELRPRQVRGDKFYIGLINGSGIALALWAGLFYLIQA